MTKSSSNNQEASLQKHSPAPADMQRLQSQLDDLKDMADLLPVLASVQEHLEEEKKKHQKRMSMMVILFVGMFGFFLVAPVYLGKSMLDQSQRNYEAQQAMQAELLQAVQGSESSEAAEAKAYAAYQQQLSAEKNRMATVLETLMLEVDAALQATAE